MHPYAAERFTEEEQDVLRRYFTNLDLPVFALVNLPEVVKGALFARYSRSPKSLRRLFLDEFAERGSEGATADVGTARAEQLYESFVQQFRVRGIETRTGQFGADMRVSIENDGPVTLVLSTDDWTTRV